MSISIQERFQGCLVGLAAGDALGTTLEFKKPGSFKPIDDMVGGGPFKLKAGEWTDDTSMALCLAESLIECEGYHPKDQMERYVRWMDDGYLASNGWCFDIGRTTCNALKDFQRTQEPYSGSTAENTQANGSLMRLAPVPMFFYKEPVEAIKRSGDSSRTTHAHKVCIDACRYFGALIVGALKGQSKEELLVQAPQVVEAIYWEDNPLSADIKLVAEGSYKSKKEEEIMGVGYAPKSLEAALWAFYHSTNFEDGALKAVNLGDDADTTGAIYGQIAGAFYGIENIPKSWREKIVMYEKMIEYADRLLELASRRLTDQITSV